MFSRDQCSKLKMQDTKCWPILLWLIKHKIQITPLYPILCSFNYKEDVNIREKEGVDYSDASIIVRSLKDPTCKEVKIDGNKINYKVEEELGIELIGDTKVKILADDNMDDWEEIVDESDAMKEIDETVDEDYLDKK